MTQPFGARRVLISTLSGGGGVGAMQAFVADCVRRGGYQPVLAHYVPYSAAPELSVPLQRLLLRRPGRRIQADDCGYVRHSIGAWFPELEFTHYWATKQWREVVASCDYHIAVSGNALAATPFLQLKKPYLCWVATGWAEDRKDRVAAHFSLPRKVLDRLVNAPVLNALEKRILQSGTILALSQHTRGALDRIAGRPVTRDIMPMPIDTTLFKPQAGAVVERRIGFSGRIEDPRKNVLLLLRAAARLLARGISVSVDLIGGELNGVNDAWLRRLGLSDRIRVFAPLSKEALAAHLRSLDVYVVPSHQEGLCIAALEAMASGCPVVSTRCGGPEEFVRNGTTGTLVNFDIDEMAAAIEEIVTNSHTREKLATGGRRLVEEHYNRRVAEQTFWQHFDAVFGKESAMICR